MKALNKLWAEMTAPKQELASQEVKLSSIDALKRVTAALNKSSNEIMDAVERFDQDIDRAISSFNDMDDAAGTAAAPLSDVDAMIDEVSEAAKSLGINVPELEDAILAQSVAEEAYQDALDRLRKYDI